MISSLANKARTALVVGAGIGGLAAGVALEAAGWRVRIFERRASARELGFGVMLAPNAVAALKELGLDQAVERVDVGSTTVEVRHPNGHLIRRLSAQGGRSVFTLRPVLHAALVNALSAEALRLSADAHSFDVHAGGVTLALKDGRREIGDVLVGADGINSVVRRRLHPHEPVARPARFAALRGMARGVSHLLEPLAAVGYLGDGVEAAVARVDRDAMYWYMSLLVARLPQSIPDPMVVAHQQARNFEPLFQAVVAATDPNDLRLDELRESSALREWGRGPVTLLGDAAHPLLPHTGQGAAQALEDAIALKLVLSPRADVESALRMYERVRSRRTRHFVRIGPRIANLTTTTNPLITSLRTMVVRWMPEQALLKIASVGSRDPHRALRV